MPYPTGLDWIREDRPVIVADDRGLMFGSEIHRALIDNDERVGVFMSAENLRVDRVGIGRVVGDGNWQRVSSPENELANNVGALTARVDGMEDDIGRLHEELNNLRKPWYTRVVNWMRELLRAGS